MDNGFIKKSLDKQDLNSHEVSTQLETFQINNSKVEIILPPKLLKWIKV